MNEDAIYNKNEITYNEINIEYVTLEWMNMYIIEWYPI